MKVGSIYGHKELADRRESRACGRISAWENLTLIMAISPQFGVNDALLNDGGTSQAAEAEQTFVRWRLEILRTIGQNALAEIDQHKGMSWHQHSITYLPRCQEMADILF